MAKFDVYPDGEGEYWLDCQSDLLSALNSRLVVPLRNAERYNSSDHRLNPRFSICGEEWVMLTHFAAAVPAKVLRQPVASLIAQEYEIGRALDVLIGAY
ncbi:CcdB family protein [Sphingomonas radiodurans]|uniref:CcdB family protein n=1 Tax=Sphingomonas radiodurans TaxID=2890321 RepID=UPI001E44B548|nr:CcdB family protein [Sphingomonas radiodurans]WBH15254.1 CcdB family protein [Sphingomonas radiodurans]